MCGITGFLDSRQSIPAENIQTLIAHMFKAINHRGPDDHGSWMDAEAGIALGFSRLAILDLSPTGHQPMLSADERYVIVFNGEIYNFAELRTELSVLGHVFCGHSDTEIILAAICQWGLEGAICRFNGMFAFALWDRRQRYLHLVRDRLGIKPLYYGWMGTLFVFGSELKALRAHPAFHADINRDAMALYLRRSYIPAPYTIYQGIYKLTPGSVLTIKLDEQPGIQLPVPYWSAREVVERGLDHPFEGDDTEAIESLDVFLRRSIGLRMIADVPLGAFLSGGVDSSAVVALMQTQSTLPVKTFTIGFKESGFDEAAHARLVAQHMGTDHTELYVTPEEARSVIPLLPALYDEPFADPSQIPTYLISKMARQHVTVSLSGDGGDEVFGGYNRYIWTTRIWKRIGWLPVSLRNSAANLIRSVSPSAWAGAIRAAGRIYPGARNFPNAGDKVYKLAGILDAGSPEAIYLDLISQWKNPNDVIIAGHEPATILSSLSGKLEKGSITDRMMFLDLVTYLPDDILVKVDRASMGVSLEARAPYLDDHELIEFAWKLPYRMKVRNGQGKWILRQVLSKYIPPKLFKRPKMGFGVPIDSWLRDPLREWAEALLDAGRLQREGFFHPVPIRQKWAEHLEGSHNWQYDLWAILMFQAWHEANG
jgi:asparagine synthase (glutamine-hydrolysing)